MRSSAPGKLRKPRRISANVARNHKKIKEFRIFQPGELKTKFPMAYNRLLEIKYKFGAEGEELESADCYRLGDERFLQYINTPKIIITDHYRLQASFNAVGDW